MSAGPVTEQDQPCDEVSVPEFASRTRQAQRPPCGTSGLRQMVHGQHRSAGAPPPPPASSPSWYPKRCCHDRDCHPADTVRRLPDGTLVLSRGAIVVRVTQSFPVEASPDGRTHFCVYESG
jgi:hypothetical protein